MRVPPPEAFTSESGYWVRPPFWAPLPEAGFDLHVPGWMDGPDPVALEYAERVPPRVRDLRAEAARHIGQAVQVRSIPRLDPEEAEIVSLFCEGGSGTVILELSWEADLCNLWYVKFRDHPMLGLHPVAFGCRAWGGDDSPWKAVARPMPE
jgi:hypothetical protein